MSIKCIAVGLRDDPERGKRLQVSVDLAKRFGAHLSVGYVQERVAFHAPIVGRGASSAFLEEVEEAVRARTQAIEEEAKEACRALPSWEWRVFEAGAKDSIVYHAHLADLVVLRQGSDESFGSEIVPLLYDFLMSSAGCPILTVPEELDGPIVGDRILVAWKNSKEAIGAVRGSLPFLREAKDVFVLADAGDRRATPPGSDIVTYLGFHGIKAELLGSSDEGGKAILKAAEEKRCDLIVMGAQGHTRLLEIVLGGATGHVVRHTTIPVLMRQ